MHGIEQKWGTCILCHDDGGHWQPGDDDPLDFAAILANAEAFATSEASAVGDGD
jgi:hypothetical protein